MTVSTRLGASSATIAPLQYPRPRCGIETKAGRSAMTTTTCTGSNARSPTLPFPFRSRSSMPPARARPSPAARGCVDDGASPACLPHADHLGLGELLGPTLDGWQPILNAENADALSAFGRPGALVLSLVSRGARSLRTGALHRRPNLRDWRGARSALVRSRRRRLVPSHRVVLAPLILVAEWVASAVAIGCRSDSR